MPTRADYEAAYKRLGSWRAVAKEFGVNKDTPRSICMARSAIEVTAAAAGFPAQASPYYWVKTKPTDDQPGVSAFVRAQRDPREAAQDALAEAIATFAERVPTVEPAPSPRFKGDPAIMDFLPFADVHIGMYAWEREGGASWSLSEAQRLILGAARQLMGRPDRGATCLLAFLGDWRHYERRDPVTNISGHIVSTDTRVGKVQATAVRLKVALIDLALSCYEHVTIVDCEGNHDEVSVPADREWTKIAYRSEPRLTVVDDDALPYYAVRHGKVFIGLHHGHIKSVKKPMDRAALAMRFVTTRATDWTASTALRTIHSGHLHFALAGWCDEFGVWFEQHMTMAAADAHGARNFFPSRRGLTLIAYHAEGGEVGRQTVPPAMVHEETA